MMSTNTRSSDVDVERKQCSFPISTMTQLLYGGVQRVKQIHEIKEIIQNDPICRNPYKFTKTREQRYTHALRMVRQLEHFKQQLQLKQEDWVLLYAYVNEFLPTFLHDNVFIPCLQIQGSQEQQTKWLPDAYRKRMIGAYAQTEMAHGSNVQGLQTTFTFIPETDEFDVHTPTLEATKWWPGNMGRTANHVVAFGRLIVKGKDLGIHSFLVQIRSYEDHSPLPGIEVGDIGSKFGTAANDNGYLRFTHVRIPRFNLLANFSKLDRDGNYERPPHAKLAYTTMIRVRSGIVQSSSIFMAKATTIAIRYSIQRRQFGKTKDGKELKILDYSIQRYRLIPLVAQAYALHFTGTEMMILYDDLQSKLKNGDVSTLPLVHATSAGLKSLTTRMTVRGIDTCRQCCGGNGFSHLSGLPEIFTDFLPMETAEGDNYLLTQQVGRYLLKVVQKISNGDPIVGPLSYLSKGPALLQEKCMATTQDEFLTPNCLLTAFRHRVARLLFTTALTMQNHLISGMKPTEAWNSVLVEIAQLSAAHCMENIVYHYIHVLEKLRSNSTYLALVPILERLFTLFCVHTMEQELGDFLEDSYLNTKQITWIHTTTRHLIDTIRPDIMGLTDAFAFTDYDLDSAIGRYDGQVYPTLWEWAQHEPLNQTQVHASWAESLKPLIHAKL